MDQSLQFADETDTILNDEGDATLYVLLSVHAEVGENIRPASESEEAKVIKA